MKTNEIILIVVIIEILLAFLFMFLIVKTNKKLKELECEHRNKFHYLTKYKKEITCMDCGKILKKSTKTTNK